MIPSSSCPPSRQLDQPGLAGHQDGPPLLHHPLGHDPKPLIVNLLSLDQARKAARIAAELKDAVHSFTITLEDGRAERWFELEGCGGKSTNAAWNLSGTGLLQGAVQHGLDDYQRAHQSRPSSFVLLQARPASHRLTRLAVCYDTTAC
jgi:hypothetical protein